MITLYKRAEQKSRDRVRLFISEEQERELSAVLAHVSASDVSDVSGLFLWDGLESTACQALFLRNAQTYSFIPYNSVASAVTFNGTALSRWRCHVRCVCVVDRRKRGDMSHFVVCLCHAHRTRRLNVLRSALFSSLAFFSVWLTLSPRSSGLLRG